MMSNHEGARKLRSPGGCFWFFVRELIQALVGRTRRRGRSPSPGANVKGTPNPDVLAQYHAAEYASERNSVDVWKTLQYALVPLMFVVWSLLVDIQDALDPVFFCWACAAVIPVCFIAYQKAMVDALTGVLLVERIVRPLAIKLAGRDDFWFHEPLYRKVVKSDVAYGWFWPPLFSSASVFAGLAYRMIKATTFSTRDWWLYPASYVGDLVGLVICCGAALVVWSLSDQGLTLNKSIDEQIQGLRLSWSEKYEIKI